MLCLLKNDRKCEMIYVQGPTEEISGSAKMNTLRTAYYYWFYFSPRGRGAGGGP